MSGHCSIYICLGMVKYEPCPCLKIWPFSYTPRRVNTLMGHLRLETRDQSKSFLRLWDDDACPTRSHHLTRLPNSWRNFRIGVDVKWNGSPTFPPDHQYPLSEICNEIYSSSRMSNMWEPAEFLEFKEMVSGRKHWPGVVIIIIVSRLQSPAQHTIRIVQITLKKAFTTFSFYKRKLKFTTHHLHILWPCLPYKFMNILYSTADP